MINNPILIALCLLVIEGTVLYISGHEKFKKYFKYIPAVFWLYFTPMVLSSIGVINAQHPILKSITTYVLPVSLFLLLISVNLPEIMKLGSGALIMFLSGSFGIMLGTVVVFTCLHHTVGDQFWSGFAALSGSWTGGSANMVAVKEALSTPDEVFLPMVIVDTVVPYLWMGVLVILAGFQKSFDRWNHADQKILNDLEARIRTDGPDQNRGIVFFPAAGVLIFAVLVSVLVQALSRNLPVVPNVVTTFTWNIIVISIFGLGLSFTGVRKSESVGSTKVGYFLLYFVLTSIGAKASIRNIDTTVILILAGLCIMAVHFACLLLAARVLKAPLFLVAVASQANVGGVASAPVVAEIYRPGLSSVGVLLAVLGNILGTYCGILTGQICYWLISTIF